MRKSVLLWLAVLVIGCGGPKGDENVVVCYTALDRMFSEPIFEKFEKDTGIKVLPKYDTESTKSVGLANAIRNEAARPRCDVFWNNEIVNTIRLKKEGLLDVYRPAAAESYPSTFRDPDGCWTGFAARARVLIVNTNRVAEKDLPKSIYDLADAKWKGKTGIAKPLFGTTATHAACLFARLGDEKTRAFFKSLKDNEIRIHSGNKSCAQSVSAGDCDFGLTDTDDAIIEQEEGKPIAIVFPDAGADQLGVLFIPNTLALIKNAPHPDAGKKLIEYLLSPPVEIALANGPSAQIPLNAKVEAKTRVKMPKEVKAMDVDFNAAADAFDGARKYIEEFFLR